MVHLLTHSLLASLYLSTTTLAQPSHLFGRQQSTCPANFSRCPQASLPSNFCCPSTATCIPLAANTTVLCCPAGSDCTIIAPITCDIAQQDTLAFPNNTLKTTALTAKLGTCGTKCCPFGYSCNRQNNCEKDLNQNIAPPLPSSSSSIPTATASLTPTTSTTPFTFSPTSSPNNNNPLPIASEQSCPRFPTPSILIFFFSGLFAGILLTLLVLLILTRCSRSPGKSLLRRASTQSFGNISSPRLQADSARTDFLRKKEWEGSPASTLGRRTTIKRVKSLFMRSPTKGSEYPDVPVPMPGPLNVRKMSTNNATTNPVTPPQQRAPSGGDLYADIMVYTDDATASALRLNKIDSGKGLGIGNGNTMNAQGQGKGRELLPPPVFNERGLGVGGERGSGQTTFTQLIERSKEDAVSGGKKEEGKVNGKGGGHKRSSSGLAGLAKGQPYVYKGSPYSDTGSRLQKM